MGNWRAILAGADRTEALRVARQIGDTLSALPPGPVASRVAATPSLAGGSAGIAVFYDYLHASFPGAGYDQAAQRLLSAAIDLAGSTPLQAGLYSGFTGVAWAVSHVLKRAGAGPEDDPVESIDDVLLEILNGSSADVEYDLVSGLVGIGLYACERLPRPAARQLLRLVIEKLAAGAEQAESGVTWWTPPVRVPDWQKATFPHGWYNLGVAHGVPGVIGLLGAACAAGESADLAGPLLGKAVDWLLAQRLPESNAAAFPSYADAAAPPRAARLAWCYGDAGIAATLLMAGLGEGSGDHVAVAVELARKGAARPRETAHVIDAGLCHGAAGLGHLFNRIYQTTGDPQVRSAAVDWFRTALAMRREGTGLAGYQAWGSLSEEWNDDPGFLTGVAGIGLALLAAATDREPAWDRLLLASAPTAADYSLTPEVRHEEDDELRLSR